jgi:hypothetical protein
VWGLDTDLATVPLSRIERQAKAIFSSQIHTLVSDGQTKHWHRGGDEQADACKRFLTASHNHGGTGVVHSESWAEIRREAGLELVRLGDRARLARNLEEDLERHKIVSRPCFEPAVSREEHLKPRRTAFQLKTMQNRCKETCSIPLRSIAGL